MINGMTEQAFINDPDTADFVMTKSAYTERFVSQHPEILMTHLLQGQFWVGYINKDSFSVILDGLGSSYVNSAPIVLGPLARPALETAGIISVQEQPYLALRGEGVLIGMVDTGIDYTKEVFIYEDGTSKIQFIYDQSAAGTPPEGFFFGQEYTNEQINTALQSEDPYAIVPQQDTVGHGTFLASVAAGRAIGDFIGAAPDAQLVIVKLKKARSFVLDRLLIPPEQENAFESIDVMIGVEYLLQKALQLNKPIIILIGLGSNFGGHDGSYVLERYLSGVSKLRGVCLCTAAGNESQARHHTMGTLSAKGEQQNIDLFIEKGSASTLLSLWSSAADRISVSIRSPTGETISRVPAKSGTRAVFPLILEKSKVGVDYYFPVEGSGAQITIIRLFNPSPGLWTITIYGDLVLDGTYHAWLPMTGFVSPGIDFLSANPYYTTVLPSTMYGSIVCGAYDSRSNRLYSDSSWGPTRTPTMAPDLVAPGEQVVGVYPQGYGTMSGTSVSAAVTAGACALLMQWGVVNQNDIAMSTYQIRAYLLRGCNRSDTMPYPNRKWGYGSLNLIQTFNLMREL